MPSAPEDWSLSAAGQWAPVAQWAAVAARWPPLEPVSGLEEPWPWPVAQWAAVAARWPPLEPVSGLEEPWP